MVKNMKNVMTGTYIQKNENGEENSNFNFYTELSAADKLRFVNTVVSLLVDDESYDFIIRDLIVDYCIIDIFTNIDTSDISECDFIDNAERFLKETNAVDIVKTNMKDGLLDELNKAIDLNIQYITGIHSNPLSDSLANLVNTLEKKVDEFDVGSVMEMVQKFVGMTGEFTTDNIVNAYLNSDVHKSNLEEIERAKKENVEIVE